MNDVERDLSLLRQVQHHLEQAVEFLGDLSLEEFLDDQMRQYAIAKALETAGEQASKVSAEYAGRHPEVPWVGLRGLRNRIVHDYEGVLFAVVYETVRRDIPPLVEMLASLVDELRAEVKESDDDGRGSLFDHTVDGNRL
ncbi:HepT-like ribonuclease domain-containing protein [Bifidobacterium choloepi]|uniref:DUF86 domain-containing protein n=1 Tax=Bifidobacterium choloepi TaxID=2614131 RepID=A0A6I5N2Q3_9BIFI|nr:HepT-like ribonuclease domain-containing protein [Bifidobacterium choloepi]NEG69939.1 DUF86 domain-containing protein [Bifidobacterium choloepi]